MIQAKTYKSGKEAYRLYRDGICSSWKQVASRIGVRSKQAAQSRARAYAEHAGLPWPLKVDPNSKKGERAYRLAKHGLSWRRIADTLEFESGASACTTARRHAELYNLPWPLHGGSPTY